MNQERSKGERDAWDAECFVFVYFSKLMVPYSQSSPKSWGIKTVKFHSPGEKRAGR